MPLPSAHRRRLALALSTVLAVGTGLAACASDPGTPAQQRAARVEARIAASFSRSQTDCIMKVLDTPTIKALDAAEGELPDDSEALRIYSNALVACAAG